MKNAVWVILGLILSIYAQEGPRPLYFLQLGAGYQVATGDFDGKTWITSEDSTSSVDSLHIPRIGASPTWMVRVGAWIGASTIALSMEQARPAAFGVAGDWWGLMVDYRYHVSMNTWRPYGGVDYGFIRWKTPSIAGSVLFNANGPGLLGGVEYHWNSLSADLRLRTRYLPVKNLSYPDGGYSILDSRLHEVTADALLGVAYRF